MRFTKRKHACVRREKDGRTLVLDPGGYSEDDAAVGADAILVTHEHPDHFDEGRLRAGLGANPAALLWAPRSVTDRAAAAFPGRVHAVGHGDAFSAAGFGVRVHGELHAVIHPDIRRIANSGYLVDGRVFHPGGVLTVPGTPVETLMVPVTAPWNRIADVIDYLREVAPGRAVDVHGALLRDLARPTCDGPFGALGGTGHLRLASGGSPEI
ncbi:MBL fold metallo-hydrolase [Streptomyces tremellae]|uniref:MBL fold metallo-hydrolase n=1 Tax=Streptomyces tremellae TaxID=1124239 RepID=UPI0031E6AFCF